MSKRITEIPTKLPHSHWSCEDDDDSKNKADSYEWGWNIKTERAAWLSLKEKGFKLRIRFSIIDIVHEKDREILIILKNGFTIYIIPSECSSTEISREHKLIKVKFVSDKFTSFKESLSNFFESK